MIPNGGLISILALIPNLLFFVFPPRDIPRELSKPTCGLEVLEWIGRIGVFAIPFFCWIEIVGMLELIAAAIMIGALGLYYAGWLRYMRRDQSFALLFQPMLGIPLPMAVAPIVYFYAASIVLHSPLLFLATVLLTIGHLYVSHVSWQDTKATISRYGSIQPPG
jgi:hypothetical protein